MPGPAQLLHHMVGAGQVDVEQDQLGWIIGKKGANIREVTTHQDHSCASDRHSLGRHALCCVPHLVGAF